MNQFTGNLDQPYRWACEDEPADRVACALRLGLGLKYTCPSELQALLDEIEKLPRRDQDRIPLVFSKPERVRRWKGKGG